MISRRTALIGGVAGVAAALAGCSGDPVTGTLTTGSFRSARRHGARTGWGIIRPPGHAHGTLPVAVWLHGRGGDHAYAYRSLHLDAHLAAVVASGTAPFAVASVDGGDHDYWHPRRASGDPAAMVRDEFLPLLADHGLAVRRVALMGVSMGGYGALYLATLLGASRVAAAVAASPAIWRHSFESAAGAFDDAADFDAHTIFGRQRLLDGIALRIDCGDRDGFAPITRTLRRSLRPTPAGGIESGAHDAVFWRSQASAELRFAGRHLG